MSESEALKYHQDHRNCKSGKKKKGTSEIFVEYLTTGKLSCMSNENDP